VRIIEFDRREGEVVSLGMSGSGRKGGGSRECCECLGWSQQCLRGYWRGKATEYQTTCNPQAAHSCAACVLHIQEI